MQRNTVNRMRGVLVNSVDREGPAERAGIRTGDVITAVNGTRIDDANALRNPVPATSESVAAGAGNYAKMCALCHGATGAGDGKLAGHKLSRDSHQRRKYRRDRAPYLET